jgi:hypothetical protein
LQRDSDLSAWDMRRGRAVFQHHETQQTMALSLYGQLMASGWGSMLHLDGITHLDDKSRGIQVWEVATGKRILWRKAEWTDATAIAFSPAGTHLAVGTTRGSVEVYELAPESWDAGAKRIRNEHGREKICEVLGEADAVVAYQAGWLFSQGGDEAVAFLKGRLRQAPATDRYRACSRGSAAMTSNVGKPRSRNCRAWAVRPSRNFGRRWRASCR